MGKAQYNNHSGVDTFTSSVDGFQVKRTVPISVLLRNSVFYLGFFFLLGGFFFLTAEILGLMAYPFKLIIWIHLIKATLFLLGGVAAFVGLMHSPSLHTFRAMSMKEIRERDLGNYSTILLCIAVVFLVTHDYGYFAMYFWNIGDESDAEHLKIILLLGGLSLFIAEVIKLAEVTQLFKYPVQTKSHMWWATNLFLQLGIFIIVAASNNIFHFMKYRYQEFALINGAVADIIGAFLVLVYLRSHG